MKKILITGASGFIGSFVVEEALRRDMEVWAVVRKTTSRRYLTDERINFIELDFNSHKQMVEIMAGKHWDYIVHAAGVTKCNNRQDFFTTNTDGTRNFVDAIIELGIIPEKFVFLSSLGAYGAIRESRPYTEILATDIPRPNTAYGESKLKAEEYLRTLETVLPTVTISPTGVYGPREKDYFLVVKSIKNHVDFTAGFTPQEITFVYVQDLVDAIFLAMEKGVVGHKYFISDGESYDSSEFGKLVKRELGNLFVLHVTMPIWLLRFAKLTKYKDKFNILKQRNWRCDINPAIQELGYTPKIKLAEGVRLTIEWYKKENWL